MSGRFRTLTVACGLAVLWAGGPAAAAAPPATAPQEVSFEAVAARLKSPEPRARLDALRQLRAAGYLEAAPVIAPLLTDTDAEVQAAAVETVLSLYLVDERYTTEIGRGIVKEKGATLPLLAFVQGPGATIANHVPPGVIGGLLEAAGASAPRVRFDAAYALAVLGRPLVLRGQFPDGAAAVARLTAFLRDSEPSMRQAGTNALGRLMGAASLNPDGNQAFAAQRVGAGDQIVGGMNDDDPDVRLASMGALGEMRYERAVQSLSDLFAYYKKGPEAMAALDAVAKIGHPGSLPVFLAQLGHRDALVRRLAVEGIGRTRDKSAMAEMEARTGREQSPYVVYARAFARARSGDLKQIAKLVDGFKYSLLESDVFAYLVELGAPAAAELATYATHKDSKVRAGVAEVLGIIGDETAVPALGMLARDKTAIVASAAARSQARLTPRAKAAARLP